MKIELKPIAQKKLAQMGATVHGVLVKNEAGAWAAVSEAGRVMWLDGFEVEAEPAQGGQGAEVMTLGRASRNGVRFEGRETYCQGWNDCMSAHPQPAQQGVPMRDLCYLYWSAYHSGHHDTVEGQYTDVFSVDRFDYWQEAVQECLEGGDMSGTAVQPPQEGE